MNLPKDFQKTNFLLKNLPSIGPKMAERLTLHLLKKSPRELEELSNAIRNLNKIKNCKKCLHLTDEADGLCKICKNTNRDQETICIVEDVLDLIAIESKNFYNGVYHILGGTSRIGQKDNSKNLTIDLLVKRIKNDAINEIIIATNPTTAGDMTAVHLKEKLREFNNLKITRISKGMPTGSDIEYADVESIKASIQGRKKY